MNSKIQVFLVTITTLLQYGRAKRKRFVFILIFQGNYKRKFIQVEKRKYSCS